MMIVNLIVLLLFFSSNHNVYSLITVFVSVLLYDNNPDMSAAHLDVTVRLKHNIHYSNKSASMLKLAN